jgi:hypothetical protein
MKNVYSQVQFRAATFSLEASDECSDINKQSLAARSAQSHLRVSNYNRFRTTKISERVFVCGCRRETHLKSVEF